MFCRKALILDFKKSYYNDNICHETIQQNVRSQETYHVKRNGG